MSLTNEDLLLIQAIVREENEPIKGELEGLRNDVKEIYDILAENDLS